MFVLQTTCNIASMRETVSRTKSGHPFSVGSGQGESSTKPVGGKIGIALRILVFVAQQRKPFLRHGLETNYRGCHGKSRLWTACKTRICCGSRAGWMNQEANPLQRLVTHSI
jgi:hypothetical protein